MGVMCKDKNRKGLLSPRGVGEDPWRKGQGVALERERQGLRSMRQMRWQCSVDSRVKSLFLRS